MVQAWCSQTSPTPRGDKAARPGPSPGRQARGHGSPADCDWQQAARSACQMTRIIQAKYSFKSV